MRQAAAIVGSTSAPAARQHATPLLPLPLPLPPPLPLLLLLPASAATAAIAPANRPDLPVQGAAQRSAATCCHRRHHLYQRRERGGSRPSCCRRLLERRCAAAALLPIPTNEPPPPPLPTGEPLPIRVANQRRLTLEGQPAPPPDCELSSTRVEVYLPDVAVSAAGGWSSVPVNQAAAAAVAAAVATAAAAATSQSQIGFAGMNHA